MKSKKQLFKDLEQLDPVRFAGVDLKHKFISDETYGKMSCIYVSWEDEKQKNKMEHELSKLGHKIKKYGSGKESEIQVSYFRRDNWDE